jgi:signal transduction histidine kinase/ActR/RegA family two-component response regulator
MSEFEGDTGVPTGAGAWRTVTLVVMALLGLAVVVGLIATLGAANRERDRALDRQTHSYEVMILARTLQSTIAGSEASLGRYVISGDEDLGRLYYDQWQRAGQQINRLDDVTDDNSEQQPRIDRLRAAYQERGQELALIAASTNYKKNDQALARYYHARQGRSLTEINRELETIIGREHTLLDQRTTAAMTTIARSNDVASVLATVGVLLVIGAMVLGWFTVRAIEEQAFARADAEDERQRSADLETAVAEATAELRDQEARLRHVQKMEAVGQLTGGIAHDFNNMLAIVIGGLELARRHLGEPDRAGRYIDSANEGAQRAAALTRQLLAFSREEALRPEALDPGVVIAGMSDLLDRTLGGAIGVTVKDTTPHGRIFADRHQLENAILNLAVNARDAMEGRGHLTIVTAARTLATDEVGRCAAGEYLTVAVRDTGSGMSPEVMERAFEPFFTTKPVGKGTGLGLSQIFAFVRQSNGEIAIESAPGAGTTVTLFLPRHVGGTIPAAPIEEETEIQGGRVGLQLLVVEDDPRVLAATMGAIEELGHHGTACSDPREAADLLDAAGIDLILSDVLMPEMTGPEMIAALDARHADIPVLFVTGFAGDTAAVDCGGHQVLRKPFTLAALDRAIQAVIRDRDAAAKIAAE